MWCHPLHPGDPERRHQSISQSQTSTLSRDQHGRSRDNLGSCCVMNADIVVMITPCHVETIFAKKIISTKFSQIDSTNLEVRRFEVYAREFSTGCRRERRPQFRRRRGMNELGRHCSHVKRSPGTVSLASVRKLRSGSDRCLWNGIYSREARGILIVLLAPPWTPQLIAGGNLALFL